MVGSMYGFARWSKQRGHVLTQLMAAEDGMIDAEDLKQVLGPNADVQDLIKQADKNHDGKIDQTEFCEMLKNM
jgi:EF-hand domain pair